MVERMRAEELLQHGIDPGALPVAPAAEPTRDEFRARLNATPLAPCAVCGEAGITARVIDAGDGPRWLDLCWPHAGALYPPRPGPVDAVAVLREAMAHATAVTGLRGPVQIWTDEEGWRDEHAE